MNTELLPCPFCGATASFTEDNSPIRDNKVVWLVGCDDEDCPAMPLLIGNARKVDAAKAWNTRAGAASVSRREDSFEDVFNRLMKVGEDHMNFEIQQVVEASEIKGERQDDSLNQEGWEFDHWYVDQQPGGGYYGDDFKGHLYFPLGEKYIRVWYNA